MWNLPLPSSPLVSLENISYFFLHFIIIRMAIRRAYETPFLFIFWMFVGGCPFFFPRLGVMECPFSAKPRCLFSLSATGLFRRVPSLFFPTQEGHLRPAVFFGDERIAISLSPEALGLLFLFGRREILPPPFPS